MIGIKPIYFNPKGSRFANQGLKPANMSLIVPYQSQMKVFFDSVSAYQQALINIKERVLDVNSEASIFFGVDSRENLANKLENHIRLIFLKSKNNQMLAALFKRVYFSVDNPKSMEKAWQSLWNIRNGSQFEKLYEAPARLTFDGKFFGENGKADTHTIGLLFDKDSKTLYVLDSLPNFIEEVKKYQEALKYNIFNCKNNEIKNIIFSNKHQQNYNEYTCNNWTIANIEALKSALDKGMKIDSTEKLNAVLPDNINKILKEQYEYVISHSL